MLASASRGGWTSDIDCRAVGSAADVRGGSGGRPASDGLGLRAPVGLGVWSPWFGSRSVSLGWCPSRSGHGLRRRNDGQRSDAAAGGQRIDALNDDLCDVSDQTARLACDAGGHVEHPITEALRPCVVDSTGSPTIFSADSTLYAIRQRRHRPGAGAGGRGPAVRGCRHDPACSGASRRACGFPACHDPVSSRSSVATRIR